MERRGFLGALAWLGALLGFGGGARAVRSPAVVAGQEGSSSSREWDGDPRAELNADQVLDYVASEITAHERRAIGEWMQRAAPEFWVRKVCRVAICRKAGGPILAGFWWFKQDAAGRITRDGDDVAREGPFWIQVRTEPFPDDDPAKRNEIVRNVRAARAKVRKAIPRILTGDEATQVRRALGLPPVGLN